MRLTVIVGDVHGCTGELEELLEAIRFQPRRDRLVFVGDLVVRGPDSRGMLALARRLGATVVRGNHEDKLLAWRERGRSVPPEHERLARELKRDDWAALEAMPLWVDLPEHGARVVHAGVIPGTEVEDSPPEALLKIRTIDHRGRWSDDADDGVLWGACYEGPPHVVFGHNARDEPQLHPWATGIDTACVYGGRLTAMVLAAGERIPRGEAARSLLRSVRAQRAYASGKGGGRAR